VPRFGRVGGARIQGGDGNGFTAVRRLMMIELMIELMIALMMMDDG
jgi:hypothetical protein